MESRELGIPRRAGKRKSWSSRTFAFTSHLLWDICFFCGPSIALKVLLNKDNVRKKKMGEAKTHKDLIIGKVDHLNLWSHLINSNDHEALLGYLAACYSKCSPTKKKTIIKKIRSPLSTIKTPVVLIRSSLLSLSSVRSVVADIALSFSSFPGTFPFRCTVTCLP